MDTISGFWAGAQDHAGGIDLEALRAEAGSWEALAGWSADDLAHAGVPSSRATRWVRATPRTTRGRALTLADVDYPPALRLMRQPPPVLFVEGDLAALHGVGLGIVGTRAATAYGRAVTRHLASAAAAAGLVVVSGLARGIDGEAHRAAALVGRTVAVLGHGLDTTAPPAHARLRADLLAAGGAIVSTWADDVPPARWTFPARNAWIAGLSQVVVVVEAAPGSGALITARHALAEGRDVAAVPGPVGRSTSLGCNALLADGALVVADVEAFVGRFARVVPRPGPEAWLAEVASGAPLDDVARAHGRPVVELAADLSRLEVEGVVVRQPGNRYALARRAE